MKKKALFVVLLFSSLCGSVLGQVDQNDDFCSTPNLDSANSVALSYYNNNQFLEDFLVQNGYDNLPRITFPNPQARSGTDFISPKFLIPLNIFIYRDGAGTIGSSITEAEARSYVCEVNRIYRDAGTAIQFYTNRVEFEANNFYNNQISTNLHIWDLWSRKRYITDHSKGINIHFIRRNNSPQDKPGKASLPHYPVAPYTQYSLYVRTHNNGTNLILPQDQIVSTLAHEIGHTLGLLHTHHPGRLASVAFNSTNATIGNGCYQESVSRAKRNYWYNGCPSTNGEKKCEVNGDFLCDTEADPNQSTRISACTYIYPSSGNYRTDNWGDLWTPPTRNVMSYSQVGCRNQFSRHQTAIMWQQLQDDLKGYIAYEEPTITSTSNIVCQAASRSFTLNGTLPNDASVTWEVSPSSFVTTPNGIGSVANLTATSTASGAARIVFTITGPGGDCYIARVAKDFTVGRPYLNATLSDGGLLQYSIPGSSPAYNSVCNLIDTKVKMMVTGGQGSWTRVAANPANTSWYPSLNDLNFYFYQVGQTATFRFTSTNTCGTTTRDYSFKSIYCSGGGCNQYSISPNPTKNIVAITAPAPCSTLQSAGEQGNETSVTLTIQSVSIFDKDGQLKMKKEYGNNATKAELDVTELKKGIYILHVSDGSHTEMYRILKD